jgi:putative NIF3 family GTP cyclohydrolase 1 type 2
MINLETITHFLDHFLTIDQYEQEDGGIYRPAMCTITRLGLALEPHPELTNWIQASQLDAIFLHRPWKLDLRTFPPQVGIFSYHLAFDESLTLGFNQRLADVLLMRELQVFGTKAGRPLGMIGTIPETAISRYCHHLEQIFGGISQQQVNPNGTVKKVVVVGAMTESLVRNAAQEDVSLYLTGQMRQPAIQAVGETGLNVVAVGHRRCEEWGLQALAGVLCERFSSLEVITYNPS